MTEKHPFPDASELNRALSRIAERSRQAVSDFLDRQSKDQSLGDFLDPFHLGNAFLQMTTQMLANPARLVEAQMSMWNGYLNLWQSATRQWMGGGSPDASAEGQTPWHEGEVFDFVKQTYLLTARWFQTLARRTGELDEAGARMVDFYTRQFVDAMAPDSFFAANPEMMRATIAAKGDNLLTGLDRLLADLDRGKDGKLIPAIGKGVAATPGKVVFRNALMELLQYAPTTKTVHKAPMLLLPPWSNRAYIFDLRPEESLVKWAIAQGHTVFALSWADPGPALAGKGFEDYLAEGPLAALEAIAELTGERKVSAVGYCLGGTLLAAAAGWLAARGEDRFASLTLLGSLVDFSEVGELAVFVGEEQLRALEQVKPGEPAAEADSMAMGLSLLRANDLIWSFVLGAFLRGREGFPFDLMAWNADNLRMPAALHGFYLHNLYQMNRLAKPGALSLGGAAIDLGKVLAPVFLVGARRDHLSPWKSVFAASRCFGGKTHLILAEGGHVDGIISPPGPDCLGHWANADAHSDPSAWLADAAWQAHSWWEEWGRWLAQRSGAQVPARRPEAGRKDAPGDNVRKAG